MAASRTSAIRATDSRSTTPRHRVFIQPFALAYRLSANDESLAFIEAGATPRRAGRLARDLA
jgi:hypothetical protein